MTTPIKFHTLNTPDEALFGYSQAVTAGNTVYISGQYSHEEGRPIGEGDFDAQVKQTFANIDKCLAKVGATRNQVVHTDVLLTHIREDVEKLTAAHAEYFGSHRPASTTWGVSGLYLPYMRLEIKVTVRLDVPK